MEPNIELTEDEDEAREVILDLDVELPEDDEAREVVLEFDVKLPEDEVEAREVVLELNVGLTQDEVEAIRPLFQKLDKWAVHDMLLDYRKSEQAFIAIEKIKQALGCHPSDSQYSDEQHQRLEVDIPSLRIEPSGGEEAYLRGI